MSSTHAISPATAKMSIYIGQPGRHEPASATNYIADEVTVELPSWTGQECLFEDVRFSEGL